MSTTMYNLRSKRDFTFVGQKPTSPVERHANLADDEYWYPDFRSWTGAHHVILVRTKRSRPPKLPN